MTTSKASLRQTQDKCSIDRKLMKDILRGNESRQAHRSADGDHDCGCCCTSLRLLATNQQERRRSVISAFLPTLLMDCHVQRRLSTLQAEQAMSPLVMGRRTWTDDPRSDNVSGT